MIAFFTLLVFLMFCAGYSFCYVEKTLNFFAKYSKDLDLEIWDYQKSKHDLEGSTYSGLDPIPQKSDMSIWREEFLNFVNLHNTKDGEKCYLEGRRKGKEELLENQERYIRELSGLEGVLGKKNDEIELLKKQIEDSKK